MRVKYITGKSIALLLLFMLLLGIPAAGTLHVLAAPGSEDAIDSAVEGTVMSVNTETDIYKDIQTKEWAGRLKTGALIFVTAEEEEWLQFLYDGEFAYIEEKYVNLTGDNEALIKEMETHEEYAVKELEEFLVNEEQPDGHFGWGIVIIVLIVLIFATGLWSARKSDGNRTDMSRNRTNRENTGRKNTDRRENKR